MEMPEILPKIMPVSERQFKLALKNLKLYRDSLWANMQVFKKQIDDHRKEIEFTEDENLAVDAEISVLREELSVLDDIILTFKSSVTSALSDEETTIQ